MRTVVKNMAAPLRLLALALIFLPAAVSAADQQPTEEMVAAQLPPSATAPVKMAAVEEDNGKDIETHVPKVPDSVKGVIRHLSTATADITLDDLNSAREAVAKLDALIDIEKRLKDLQNLRREREEKSMANAIPASAFGMPRGMPMPMPVSSTPQFAAPMGGSIDVMQVAGSNGRYTATVKEFGSTRTVRAGDRLADGSTVRSVTAQGVEVAQGKSERLIRIKGAGNMSGEAP